MRENLALRLDLELGRKLGLDGGNGELPERLDTLENTKLLRGAMRQQWALVAFALGQTAYGLTMLLSFVVACREDLNFYPKQVAVTVHDK